MKGPNQLGTGFCVRCGGVLLDVSRGSVPMCSVCKKSALEQLARMKTRKALKKKQRKG